MENIGAWMAISHIQDNGSSSENPYYYVCSFTCYIMLWIPANSSHNLLVSKSKPDQRLPESLEQVNTISFTFHLINLLVSIPTWPVVPGNQNLILT